MKQEDVTRLVSANRELFSAEWQDAAIKGDDVVSKEVGQVASWADLVGQTITLVKADLIPANIRVVNDGTEDKPSAAYRNFATKHPEAPVLYTEQGKQYFENKLKYAGFICEGARSTASLSAIVSMSGTVPPKFLEGLPAGFLTLKSKTRTEQVIELSKGGWIGVPLKIVKAEKIKATPTAAFDTQYVALYKADAAPKAPKRTRAKKAEGTAETPAEG